MARLPPKIRRMHRRRSANGRPRTTTAWLALVGLVFQLFITQVHGFMGPFGWSIPSAAPDTEPAYAQAVAAEALCLSPVPEGGAAGRSDYGQRHRDECPIFQSLAIVGASLPAAAIELPPAPSPEARPALRLAADSAVPALPQSRHRSRAPPLSA